MLNLNDVVFTTSTGFGCIFEKLILDNKLHIEGSVIPDAMHSKELMSFSYAFLNEQLIGWCCFQYINNKFIEELNDIGNKSSEKEIEFTPELFTHIISSVPPEVLEHILRMPYFLGTLGIFVKPEYRKTWLANKLINTCKLNILPHLNNYMNLKRKDDNYEFFIDVEPHILKFVKRYFGKVCKVVSRR